MFRRLTIIICAMMSLTGLSARELPMPTAPSDLRETSARAEYVLMHFWAAMDWRDTTLTRDSQFMEQSSANFYSIFPLVDSLTASNAVEIMLTGASADPFAYNNVAEIAQIYLFEPESPIADDEAYLVVADRLLSDKKLPEADLLRVADRKRQAMINRLGCKAADFEYVDRQGNHSTLYQALSQHPENILIFYDPDCHVCAELEERLMSTSLGDTGVIMISPYGEQNGLWAQHAATMPASWIVGRPTDEDFEDEEIYDLRATPTVLMIDRTGTVLSKKPF